MGASVARWTVSKLRQFIKDTVTNKIYFKEQSAAPNIRASTSEAVIYAKDSSGTTKLYYKDSAGTEVELGSGAAGVLSQQTPITQITMVSGKTYVLYDNTEVSGDLVIETGGTAIIKTSWPE